MKKQWLFDRTWTKDFTSARQARLQEFLQDARSRVKLDSAIDVGCGTGDFSKFLYDLGLQVVGVDGRKENAEEARKRHPEIDFLCSDAEELQASRLGSFDLVICFGLLYHVENPFRVIRNLSSLTEKVLVLESMCVPDLHPTMCLFDEAVAEDQGLSYVAFYPSEACLIKMMYKAGFSFVYGFRNLPNDALYTETFWRRRVRSMLVGSRTRLESAHLILLSEPYYLPPDTADLRSYAKWNPWSTWPSRYLHYSKGIVVWLLSLAGRILRPLRRALFHSKAVDGERG